MDSRLAVSYSVEWEVMAVISHAYVYQEMYLIWEVYSTCNASSQCNGTVTADNHSVVACGRCLQSWTS